MIVLRLHDSVHLQLFGFMLDKVWSHLSVRCLSLSKCVTPKKEVNLRITSIFMSKGFYFPVPARDFQDLHGRNSVTTLKTPNLNKAKRKTPIAKLFLVPAIRTREGFTRYKVLNKFLSCN